MEVWTACLARTLRSRLCRAGQLPCTLRIQAIGRSRWEQTLTIAYRNDQFVVAGYTYSYYDHGLDTK
jgi:hypothetical protein